MGLIAEAASSPTILPALDAAARRRARAAEAMQRVMTNATVDVVDAGAVLGVGRSCAYAAAVRGDIPSLRIGEKLRVPTAALREMLKLPAAVPQHNSSVAA